MTDRSARWIEASDTFIGDTEPDDNDAEDWVIRDLIPRREPWMLAGKWKGGKTWGALWLGVCVALGLDCFGFTNTLGPAKVLLVLLEDDRRRLQKRVWSIARGLGLTDDQIVTLRANLRVTGESLHLPHDLRSFRDELQAWEPDAVIVDSLSRVMAGNQNSTEECVAFADAWCELIRETGAAIGLLHHTNKFQGEGAFNGDLFDQIRGSGVLPATARNLILMKRIDGTDTSEVHMRGNLELERDNFVLEFVQSRDGNGLRVVKLENRGQVKEHKSEHKRKAQAMKKAAKEARKARTTNDRYRAVLERAVSERVTGDIAMRLLGLKSSEAGKVLTAMRKHEPALLDRRGEATAAGRAWLTGDL